jgi:uncharacterized repeat protein (TIGR03803 family)
MTKLTTCAVVLFCAATAIGLRAQTFASLASFDYADGSSPQYGSLAQGFDGDLYGSTVEGAGGDGAFCNLIGCGAAFKITPGGSLTTLYTFCTLPSCTDGGLPEAGLAEGSNGSLYGTTYGGGAYGRGTIFSITPDGTLTTIYSFCSQANCVDGSSPYSEVIQGTDGSFYGTTFYGGANADQCDNGCGVVFKVTPEGQLTTLYNFCSLAGCADGQWPIVALVQGSDGDFYGSTRYGGSTPYCLGCGTLFKITPSGTLTTLYSFCSNYSESECIDGSAANSSLIQARGGNFYGTTAGGGTEGHGTVFEVTAEGSLTTLHSFDDTDGGLPESGLVQATDGEFYGTTYTGGDLRCGDVGIGCGTLFKMTPSGDLTTLHKFDGSDGAYPLAGLVQATDGNLYGTTESGDVNSGNVNGTVFSLSMGLEPFAETLPTSRGVGGHVIILGNNLTGSTSVSFNGTPAKFTVVSDTEITATVPPGATSGFVTVSTTSGKLTSNKMFQVIP